MDVEFRNLTFKVDQGIRGYVPFLSGKGKSFVISNVKYNKHDGCFEVMFMLLLNIIVQCLIVSIFLFDKWFVSVNILR